MNAGAMIAVMVAAAAHKARQDAEDAFRVAGATAPERARTLDALGLTENTAVRSTLIPAGIVCGVGERGQVLSIEEAQDHTATFYLDEAAILAERTRRSALGKRPAILVFCLLLVLALALIALQAR